MIRRTLLCLVVAVSMTGSVALQAHHSLAGVYDVKGEKALVGTVVKIQFVNPHGSLTLSVKNPDGTTTDWICTLGSARRLSDRGLGRDTLKVGDTVTAKIHPSITGSPLGYLKGLITSDGKEYELSGTVN